MYHSHCRVCNHEWESKEKAKHCEGCGQQDQRAISSSFTEDVDIAKSEEPTVSDLDSNKPDESKITDGPSESVDEEAGSNLSVEGEASASIE